MSCQDLARYVVAGRGGRLLMTGAKRVHNASRAGSVAMCAPVLYGIVGPGALPERQEGEIGRAYAAGRLRGA